MTTTTIGLNSLPNDILQNCIPRYLDLCDRSRFFSTNKRSKTLLNHPTSVFKLIFETALCTTFTLKIAECGEVDDLYGGHEHLFFHVFVNESVLITFRMCNSSDINVSMHGRGTVYNICDGHSEFLSTWPTIHAIKSDEIHLLILHATAFRRPRFLEVTSVNSFQASSWSYLRGNLRYYVRLLVYLNRRGEIRFKQDDRPGNICTLLWRAFENNY